MIDLFKNSRHQLLLTDPFEVLLTDLQRQFDQQFIDFYQQEGFNLAIVHALIQHQPLDVNSLRCIELICVRLQRILITPDQLFEITHKTSRTMLQYFARVFRAFELQHIYHPSFDRYAQAILDLMGNIPRDFIARLRALKNASEVALNKIDSAKDAILTGHRKKVVTEKWLQLIDESVLNFLTARGFSPDSIPSDYISQPPSDLLVIQAQHHLLQQILDPADDLYGIRAFVASLRDEIREIVDEYIFDVISVLFACLSVTSTAPPSPASVIPLLQLEHYIQTFELQLTAFSSDSPPPSPEEHAKYQAVIADLRYLSQMLLLESEIGSAPSAARKLEISHVVPISGLIMSKFHIIEQELATVLEVWQASGHAAAAAAAAAATSQHAVSSSPPRQTPSLGSLSDANIASSPSWPMRVSLNFRPVNRSGSFLSRSSKPSSSRLPFLSAQRILSPAAPAVNPLSNMGPAPLSPAAFVPRKARTFSTEFQSLSDIAFLRQALASPDFDMDEALFHSLVTLGLNVNLSDAAGNTLLMTASKYGSLRSIYTLINASVQADLFNEAGESAFHMFIARSFASDDTCQQISFLTSIITKFVDACGIHISSIPSGNTPLHACVMGQASMDIIPLLLRFGADPNKENNYGESPLFISISNNQLSPITLFLLHGASISKKCAQAAHSPEVKKLIHLKSVLS